jgi:hypothetical protein
MFLKRIKSELKNIRDPDIGHLAKSVIMLRIKAIPLALLVLPFLLFSIVSMLFAFLAEKIEFLNTPYQKVLRQIEDNYAEAHGIKSSSKKAK